MSLVNARAVTLSLGKEQILADLNMEIPAGEVVGLIGPNGVGKTTLLKVLAGLLEPDSGIVRLDGRSIGTVDRSTRARLLAYLPQDGGSHWSVTAETLVMLGRLPYQTPWRGPSRSDHAAVAWAMAACDVTQFRNRPVTQLSGGERARVLLARALVGRPKILLADEPVAGLDPGHQLDVMRRLRDLAQTGAGVVVVMHDLTLAARYCDRLVLLHGKQIAAEGRPTEVLTRATLERCYGIRAYHGTADGQAIIVPLARSGDEHGHAQI